jgi:hypothetical protein
VEKPTAEIQFDSWPRITPGEYPAYSKRAAVYFDKHFKRWVCLVRFEILDANMRTLALVPWFLNLGRGNKPHMGRRSNFYLAWVQAAGGKTPTRTDRPSVELFKRRHATVLVRDTEHNFKAAPVDKNTCYSVVRAVKSWDTGESISQSVNQSTKPRVNRVPLQEVTEKPWQEKRAPEATSVRRAVRDD